MDKPRSITQSQEDQLVQLANKLNLDSTTRQQARQLFKDICGKRSLVASK